MNTALDAMSGDAVGVSGVFGKPILVYALMRLGRYEAIDTILEGAEKGGDDVGGLSAKEGVRAIGAALAENGQYERLEKAYHRLQKPLNRACLAMGVLMGLP